MSDLLIGNLQFTISTCLVCLHLFQLLIWVCVAGHSSLSFLNKRTQYYIAGTTVFIMQMQKKMRVYYPMENVVKL